MIRAAILLAVSTWLGCAGTVRGQEDLNDKPVHLPANGTQLFRALVDFAGVKPAAQSRNPRDRLIVVVFGNPGNPLELDAIQTATRTALLNGGAVLILSDQNLDLSANMNPLEGKFLPNSNPSVFLARASVQNPSKCYRDLPDCPFVLPGQTVVMPGTKSGYTSTNAEGSPFFGLSNVATNKPGLLFLLRDRNSLPILADYYPGNSAVHQVPRNVAGQYVQAFAAGQLVTFPSPARWLAIADEDVLSNSLLASKGTDNFLLAFQLVNWLRGPEGRTECLFFEYGRRVDKFDDVKFVTLPDLPAPPLPPVPPLKMIEEQLTDFGNRMADEVQTNDRIHSNLVRDEEGYARWLRFLAMAAAAVAAFYLLRRAIASRQPMVGPPITAVDDGPPGKLLAVLRQEMVRGNNFTPAVVAYIEETFRIAGLPAGPHAAMPPVAITGKKVKKVELMADIQTLWRVWHAPAEKPIHYAVWREMEPAVEHVRRLAVKGRWHFAPDFVPPGGAA